MIVSLAAGSVDRKCEMLSSVIVGNYEFYYAAGKLAAACEASKAVAFAGDENTPPDQMKEIVMEALKTFEAADEHQEYLARMLKRYRPSERYDEQMAQLFLMGKA